jgi:outer membrane protein
MLLPVAAEAQGWELGARVIGIIPDDDSDQIGDTGTRVTVDENYTLEVDITYMFSERVGLEVIAATAEHDINAVDGALAGASAGSVWVLPPTFTLMYRFPAGLYLGVGLNYTLFYNYDLSDDLRGAGVTDIEFSDSFGVAGNVGWDFFLGDNWYFNIDLKYIQIQTDAKLKTATGVLDEISVDINPWVPGVGFGYRF